MEQPTIRAWSQSDHAVFIYVTKAGEILNNGRLVYLEEQQDLILTAAIRTESDSN
jgi:hypothetical protein